MSLTRVSDSAQKKAYGALTISGIVPTPIPAIATVGRTAIYIFNNNASGGAVLTIGYDLKLLTTNGIPIAPQTGWQEDIVSAVAIPSGGTAPVIVYGCTAAGSTVDVRWTESGNTP